MKRTPSEELMDQIIHMNDTETRKNILVTLAMIYKVLFIGLIVADGLLFAIVLGGFFR